MRFLLRQLSAINGALCRYCIHLVSVFLVFICIILTAAVTSRYVLNAPIAYAEDTVCFLLVWLVLLGAPTAMRNRAHVTIDLLVDKFPAKVRLLLRIINTAAIVYVAWIVVWYGASFVSLGMKRIIPSIDWLKFGYSYLALPVGFGLVGIICLELILRDILELFGISEEG